MTSGDGRSGGGCAHRGRGGGRGGGAVSWRRWALMFVVDSETCLDTSFSVDYCTQTATSQSLCSVGVLPLATTTMPCAHRQARADRSAHGESGGFPPRARRLGARRGWVGGWVGGCAREPGGATQPSRQPKPATTRARPPSSTLITMVVRRRAARLSRAQPRRSARCVVPRARRLAGEGRPRTPRRAWGAGRADPALTSPQLLPPLDLPARGRRSVARR